MFTKLNRTVFVAVVIFAFSFEMFPFFSSPHACYKSVNTLIRAVFFLAFIMKNEIESAFLVDNKCWVSLSLEWNIEWKWEILEIASITGEIFENHFAMKD